MLGRMRARLWLVTLLVGCGGSTPTPDDPTGVEAGDTAAPAGGGGGFSSSSRVGALDKEAVRAAVGDVMRAVNRCIDDGRKRLPFLGGSVGVRLEVNTSGRASVAYLDQSTLGDHQVEACVLEAFQSHPWPRPVGGEVGEISQSFDFTAGHAELPDDWSAAELQERMQSDGSYDELLGKLRDCRAQAGAGRLEATMYLDEDGLVRGAGVAMGDPKGIDAVDCVVTTLQTTSFPAPRSNFVKVTVAVP